MKAFFVEDGKDATKPSDRIELKATYVSPGKFSVSIPEELQGKNGKPVAYAETAGSEMISRLVWRKTMRSFLSQGLIS